ncbi:terpene synthase family protein [Herbidospora mongoliensis]|uniref:terpene synthase family protein n=1 Tax=Herbidospora mongoliensis TaxID=688067 RepID=UPI00082D7309|nr:terpene synthase family protein [Herbidospora mongoliensis]
MPVIDPTRLFDLPELPLIPGDRKAPWGPDLDGVLAAFVRETGLLTTETAERYYAAQHIGTMCAYVAPGAVSRARREIYGKLQTWFFIYDDWAEQLGRFLQREDVADVTDIVLTWFAESEDDCRRLDLAAARSMREIWAQIQQDSSPDWRHRLREELGVYLRTAVEEAELVRSGRVNPFGKASELRPLATAAQAVFTLSEFAYGIELPRELIRHPFLRRISRATTIAIAYANDIIGLKADLLRGIRDNLVLSLQEEYGGDLQTNVERAAKGFQRVAGEFTDLQSQFRSGGGLCDHEIAGRPDVEVYIQILEDWIYEGIKWQLLDTNRYQTTVRLTQQEHPNQLLSLTEALPPE